MKTFTVWYKHTGVNEKCLMKEDGDYIGINTGTLYKKEDGHHHSKQHIGVIIGIESVDQTGMMHLDQDSEGLKNKQQLMKSYIGCYVTLEAAHWYGKVRVYRCLELDDYVTSNEVKILTEQQVRQWKIEQVLSDKE